MDFKTSNCYNHKIVKEKSFLRKYDTENITLGGAMEQDTRRDKLKLNILNEVDELEHFIRILNCCMFWKENWMLRLENRQHI